MIYTTDDKYIQGYEEAKTEFYENRYKHRIRFYNLNGCLVDRGLSVCRVDLDKWEI